METIMNKLSKVFKPIVTSIANDIKSIETNVSKLEQEFDKLSNEGTSAPSTNNSNLAKATARVSIGTIAATTGNFSEDAYLVFNRVGNNVSVYLECEGLDSQPANTHELDNDTIADGIITNEVPKGFTPAVLTCGVCLSYLNHYPLAIDGSKIYIPNHNLYSNEMATVILNYTTTDEFPAN